MVATGETGKEQGRGGWTQPTSARRIQFRKRSRLAFNSQGEILIATAQQW